MPLTDAQLARLKSLYQGLTLDATCTLSNTFFRPGVTLRADSTITWSRIGRGAIIGNHTHIHSVTLGDHCSIGHGCSLGAPDSALETIVGNHVHIGSGARIAPGVHLPDNTIVPPESELHVSPPGPLTPWQAGLSDPDDALPLREFILEKLPLVQVHKHWLAARGDQTLRVDYALNPADLALDIGGFQGDWAQQIADRYACRIIVFEPVPPFADTIRQRLGNKATVHPFGLAGTSREEQISLAGESSSVFAKTAAQYITIKLIAAADILRTLPTDIALAKINIEGAEYELLEHLIEQKLISRIRHLQIQFHDFVPNARPRRRAIRALLQGTHAPAYNYPFIWEGWTRRP